MTKREKETSVMATKLYYANKRDEATSAEEYNKCVDEIDVCDFKLSLINGKKGTK